MVERSFPQLDKRERHFRIPSHRDGLSLFLRYLPPARGAEPDGKVALYVHRGTFPSALSIAHRFDGRSWRDELAASGFHCWGLDFHGFGRFSDPYPEMAEPDSEIGFPPFVEMPLRQHRPLARRNIGDKAVPLVLEREAFVSGNDFVAASRQEAA
jgi:hypothetical protein